MPAEAHPALAMKGRARKVNLGFLGKFQNSIQTRQLLWWW